MVFDRDRRRFLTSAAMTMAASHFDTFGSAEAADRDPRELAAIGKATDWINSPRLTAAALRGKVVLVDFWTYTCINWLRTLPYVRAWSEKYQQSLVVIGVHTPEFAFEHDLDNVRRAVKQLHVDYPVVIDNDYAIWRAFRNQYWPALYLIDAHGNARHHQFGEGEYVRSELAIQKLLSENGAATAGGAVAVAGSGFEAPADWAALRSPETYLGYGRTDNFISRVAAALDLRRSYVAPAKLALNQWSLNGEWTMGSVAAAVNQPGGQIAFRFHARDVHLVMGPARHGGSARFRLTVDGLPPGAAHGLDVDETGFGMVTEQRLHQLIRQPRPIVDRTLVIEFLDAGAEAFSFTFG
jgi:thiol-disulfide isomerase/thioredoxin